MELKNIIDAQRELDARIIKEKGLEGQDLVANTFVALQVELGEMANEARWFKHWSNRQTPKVEQEKCDYCDEDVDYTRPSPFMSDVGTSMCKTCWDMTKEEYAASHDEQIPDFEDYPHFKKKIPTKLLEEFADSVHFFVSAAIQKGWEDVLWLFEEQLDPGEFKGDLTGWYLEMIYFINDAYMKIYGDEKIAGIQKNAYSFRMAWMCFLNIGMNGFGFTWEQIYDAYFEKNKVNHERLESGY